MNSTDDKELLDIIKLSGSLAQNYVFNDIEHKKDSYWNDSRQCKLFPENLCNYTIDTPVKLKLQLQDMWHFQNCDYMMEYAVLLTIAAFKNNRNEKENIEISDFIYEF